MTPVEKGLSVEALPDAEIVAALAKFPQMREKTLIDMINGVAVGREHIGVQRRRLTMLSRVADAVTGEGSRRQIEINENLAAGVEGAVAWLKELEAVNAKTNVQIVRMNWCLGRLTDRLSETRSVVVEVDRQLQDLVHRVGEIRDELSSRLDRLEGRVERLEWIHRAQVHLQRAFNDWHEGRYDSESLLTQAYLVLDDLYWGEFGAACLRFRGAGVIDAFQELSISLRPALYSELLSRLSLVGGASDLAKPFWLDRWRTYDDSSARSVLHPQLLVFLGDWADADDHPCSFTATRHDLNPPLRMPLMLSVAHASNLLQQEVFGGSRV
jgi:hypothetical protein